MSPRPRGLKISGVTFVHSPTTQGVEGHAMPPTHDESQCYCLHCLATVRESDEACPACGACFAGSGAFDRVHGPRPSATFRALFAPAPAAEPALAGAIGLVAA